MAKKKKYTNKKAENRSQKKFLRELKIPDGQVRERLLNQEDKDLVLDQYQPVDTSGVDKSVISDEKDTKKRYEDLEFGIAINTQVTTKKRRLRSKRKSRIKELVDVVECHIYDTDDTLLKTVFVSKGDGWDFINNGEKQFNTDTGEQKRYDRIVLNPHLTLRKVGFKRGTYRLHYNFHRNRLGSDFTFYIDPEAETGYRSSDAELVKKEKTTTLDDGSIVRTRNGKPTNRYLKTYEKKLFIQEISPSRTEIRALPVNSFSKVITNKFNREFTGRRDNFEIFDKKIKTITTADTGIFFTVDTTPEKPTGNKKAITGTSLVTVSKTPGTSNRKLRKLFRFSEDMVGGVLTIPRKGISGVNTFDLYEDFEAEIVEFIDEQTVRVSEEFRQPTPIGDVNLDEHVNLLDFNKLFAYIQGEERLTGLAQYQADLDQDGRIDLADALWTLRVALQEVKRLGVTRQNNGIIGKGVLTADRIFGVANDLLNHYKMTAAQRTIFDINRDGRIDTIDLLRFLDDDVIDVVTEITQVLRRPFKIEYENPYYDERRSLRFLMNFGDNERHLITNWEPDDVTYPEYPNSLVIKLYEPLPKNITQKSYFHIVEEFTPSVIEDVVLTGAKEPKAGWKLRPPNWDNVDTSLISKSEPVELSSWDDLLSTDAVTSQQLVDKYFSGSYDGTDLDVDYSNYNNYVHFGSAAERLANFKYKLQLLETYSSSIALESTISGSVGSISSYKSKQQQIIGGFDSYEKFLYFESGSSYTDSFGVHIDRSWPKTEQGTMVNEPYKLAKVDSQQATTWYEEQFSSASLYDSSNENNLLNTLPIHIKENDENEQYFLFLDMIGQHFDTLWLYIKHLTQVTKRTEIVEEGVPQDLVYHIVKSMGHQLDLGSNVLELWEYALGSDPTGSIKYSNGQSYEDTSKETWRRIANNLPYILKHKGTGRSIKALLSCYGVPQTILKVREYGGPLSVEESTTNQLDNYRKGSFIEDSAFVYASRFSGAQTIQGSWNNTTPSGRYPDAIQLRFKTSKTRWDKPFYKQTLFSVGNDWAVYTEQSSSSENKGRIVFAMSASDGTSTVKQMSTDWGTIYDDNWHNVLLQRVSGSDNSSITQSYELYVKKFDDELSRISWNQSSSLSLSSSVHNASWTGSASNFNIGSGFSGESFVGNIMEHRQWITPLSESVFENHTNAPQSYNGNTFVGSYDDMVLRWKLDQAKDYSSGNVSDTKPNQLNVSPNSLKVGTPSGFGTTDYDDTYITNKMITPSMGPNRRVDNKIRIEDNDLFYGNLSVNKRSEKSSGDTAPNDSPKIGIYLSPGDLLNDDIVRNFADFDFDQLIGDPRDRYRDNYKDLQFARELYFRKFTDSPIDLNGYLDIVRLYDLSLFDQIKKLLPARSKPASGVLVEPHILERPKIKWEKPVIDNNSYEGEMSPEPTASGEYLVREGETKTDPVEVMGDTLPIEGEAPRPVILEGEEVTLEGDYERTIIAEGERTDYEGEGIETFQSSFEGERSDYEGDSITTIEDTLEGERTDYEGESVSQPVDLEGREDSYDGDSIEGTSVSAEGEETSYKGIVSDSETTLEGDTKHLEDTIEKPLNEIEGNTLPLEGVVPPVDEATVEGDTIDIEAIWVNPHKNVSSEYNRKEYVKELAVSSSHANYTASAWDGYQDVPKTVYTMAGAKFPSHFPDVKGNTSHSIEYLSEALLPIYGMDAYRPELSPYVRKNVLMETNFNKGQYASTMKQKTGVGYETIGSAPHYFKASEEVKYRGWYSGSATGATFELPFFVLDDDTIGSEELLVDEFGNYVKDGAADYDGDDSTEEVETATLRSGKPKTFELQKMREYDPDSQIAGKYEEIQALYIENEVSSSGLNLSQSFWTFDGLDEPDDIEWEIGGGRGYYARFGTKGSFEMDGGELYQIDFRVKVAGTYNSSSLLTVHLLGNIDDEIDREKDYKAPWGSQLLGDCYRNATFRKQFRPRYNGTYKIVFVLHGGKDHANNAHPPMKFYLMNFKLTELERSRHNSPGDYASGMKNLFFNGCKQTINTTPDGLPPVEWTDTNPNVLVVDPDGSTELDVN